MKCDVLQGGNGGQVGVFLFSKVRSRRHSDKGLVALSMQSIRREPHTEDLRELINLCNVMHECICARARVVEKELELHKWRASLQIVLLCEASDLPLHI